MSRALVLLAALGCAAPRAPHPPPDPSALSYAVWGGDAEAVRALLARGASPDALDELQRTPLTWAMAARDRPMIELLLAHAPARLGETAGTGTALREAAGLDEPWLIDALVAHGMAVDGDPEHRASALMVAAENGAIESMRHLIAAGASASYADAEGDTPLAAAVRAGCGACVELVLAQHADVAHVDQAGRSALWWAIRTGQPELRKRLADAGAPDVSWPAPPPPPTAAEAIARAVPQLQRANASWIEDGECTACHQLPMAVHAIAVVDRLGFPVDPALRDAAVTALRDDDARFAAAARTAFATPDGVLKASMPPAGDIAFGNGWFLAAELDAGGPAGPDQRTLATFQARMQQPDGRWRAGPLRGVIEWSDLEATALAIHAITGYGDADARAVLPAAERWLARARPETIVDHVAVLRGRHDLGRDVAAEVAALRALQHADGSWSHLPGPGDAYSTGYVAVALIEAGGVDRHDPAIARAADYLLRTQDPDGTWLVPSRAPQLLVPSERGFPHGKLQFISFAGTAWAAMALAYAAASGS
jgi:hypothetical protein